jgi:ABC-type Fe2+-enterobactin transport system substrate-binding protein
MCHDTDIHLFGSQVGIVDYLFDNKIIKELSSVINKSIDSRNQDSFDLFSSKNKRSDLSRSKNT